MLRHLLLLAAPMTVLACASSPADPFLENSEGADEVTEATEYDRLLGYLDGGWSLQHVAEMDFSHDFEMPDDLGDCEIENKEDVALGLRANFDAILANEDSSPPGIDLDQAMVVLGERMGDGDFLVCTKSWTHSDGFAERSVYRGLNSGFKLREFWLYE